MDDPFQQIRSEDAIAMAVESGELLFRQRNDIHDWALTLIISHLFELAGQDTVPDARFERGFKRIMGDACDRELPFGWHPRFVAEAIRNLFDHGMSLNRKQTRNYHDTEKVEVMRMGFLPAPTASAPDLAVFEIEELGVNQFGLMVSPVIYRSYFQDWNRRRTAT